MSKISKKKLIEKYQPKLPENAVVLTRKERSALINEFNALQHKYDDLCDRYRLCIEENGQFRLENNDLEAQITQARKTTAREIFDKIKSEAFLSSGVGWLVAVEDINELAKQYGVEVEVEE